MLPTAAFLQDASRPQQPRVRAESLHFVYEGEDIPASIPAERTVLVDVGGPPGSQVVRGVTSLAPDFQAWAAVAEGGQLVVHGASVVAATSIDELSLKELIEQFALRNEIIRQVLQITPAAADDLRSSDSVEPSRGEPSPLFPLARDSHGRKNDTESTPPLPPADAVFAPRRSSTPSPSKVRPPSSPYRVPNADGLRSDSPSPPPPAAMRGVAHRQLFDDLQRFQAGAERFRQRAQDVRKPDKCGGWYSFFFFSPHRWLLETGRSRCLCSRRHRGRTSPLRRRPFHDGIWLFCLLAVLTLLISVYETRL